MLQIRLTFQSEAFEVIKTEMEVEQAVTAGVTA